MSTGPDMTASIAPRSDQLNAEDLITGPCTITITDVKRGSAEQPVDMVTEEFGPGRPYKPSKTMRRIIVTAWGTNAADYVGRRITIYRDPDITFGRDRVGGIRISHLSHIDKRLEIALTVTRGRRATFKVEPLKDAAVTQTRGAEQPDDPPPADDGLGITKPQLQKLSILRQRHNYADTDEGRADWFRWVETSIGRFVASNKDLTKAEASVLIDILETDEADSNARI